ncbi:hypothetical protein [Streptomyces sp. NPDC058304]|uniref:hypothetical protein n=1 Tax=Streptomyces sp. NPDC058304 TaxID=3346437 RepID=UPI0036E8C3F5
MRSRWAACSSRMVWANRTGDTPSTRSTARCSVGYENASTLTTLLRQRLGTTPGRLRTPDAPRP